MNLTLPDGEVIKHGYDIGGNLNHISGRMDGADYDYLESLTYDKFGQRRSMTLGNGINTQYYYEPEHRRLCKLETGSGLSRASSNQCQTLPRVSSNEVEQTALTSALNNITASNAGQFQNLHYAYDNVGNILGTSNRIQTPKRNEMGGPTVQTFQYDDLYRLTKAKGSYLNAQGNEHRYTLDMEYSNIHNITSKDQFHEVISKNGGSRTQTATTYDWGYQYQTNGHTQPHAPTHIGNRQFSYDANGNQTGWTNDNNGQKRNITWDDENRIQKIGDPSNTLTFAYDDAGQRVLKRGQQGQTEYVNQFFTVRNQALHSKHIFAGTSRIASKVEPGQPVGKFGDDITTTSTTTTTTSTETTLLESIQQTASEVITEVKTFFGLNEHPGQGLEHRSDRANEVARNTEKNKHLNGGIPGGEHGSSNSNAGGNGNNSGNNGNDDNGNQSNNANDNANSGNGNSRAPYDYGGTFLYYYHPDHLGSTGYVTDENADLYEHIEYFPFGETWLQEAANTYQRVPYRYTSKELDTETGLYYYGARYYDPRTSVWQSVDPVDRFTPDSPTIGLNLYQYTLLNPLRLVDPDGRLEYDPSSSTGEDFKITSGDTLSKISQQTGVSQTNIMAANSSIKDRNKIKTGASIKIPSLSAGAASSTSGMDAVVTERLNQVNPKSVSSDYEYAGLLYQTKPGVYYSTPGHRGANKINPLTGGSSQPFDAEPDLPIGISRNNIVAGYHTHGTGHPELTNEILSSGDTAHANQVGSMSAFPNYQGLYMGSPGGSAYYYPTGSLSTWSIRGIQGAQRRVGSINR